MGGVAFPQPYLSLYNASARALKAVDKSLRVGGPATMQTLDVDAFIKAVHSKSEPIPVDFVSTHFYPTDPQCQTKTTKTDPDCFAHTVLAAQRLASDAGLPFFITEYNNGLGGTSRDDSSAAAFVFRHMALMEKLDMFSWWTFSDVFEEGWMQSDPFHNGYGMMTVHGVRKPVWRAFEMLAGAGNFRIPVSGFVSPADGNSDISVLATTNKDLNLDSKVDLQLFVANYHRLGNPLRYKCDAATSKCVEDAGGSFTDEALCNANCGQDASLVQSEQSPVYESISQNVTLIISHAEGIAIPSTVTAYRIDADHANPMAKWSELGKPKYPTKLQIEEMASASEVGNGEEVHVQRVNATASSLSFLMPPNSAMHLSMRTGIESVFT